MARAGQHDGEVFDLTRRRVGYDVEYVYDADEVPGIACDAIARGARVLDVGCGGGGFATLLRERKACQVVGIEPDPLRAGVARERGLEVIEAPFSGELAVPGAPFDAVCFLDVLEHAFDPRALLVAARGLLAEGGCVVVSVPNVAHWSIRLGLLAGRFEYDAAGLMDYTHLRWFTRASLRGLLASAGLAPVEERPALGAWLPAYRRLPMRARKPLLRAARRVSPGLFASQLVVMARPRAQLPEAAGG